MTVETKIDQMTGDVKKLGDVMLETKQRLDDAEATLKENTDAVENLEKGAAMQKMGGHVPKGNAELKAFGDFAKDGGTGEIQYKDGSTLVDSEGGYAVTVSQDPNIQGIIPHASDVIDDAVSKVIDGKTYEKIIAVTAPPAGNVVEKGARPDTDSTVYAVATIETTDTYASPRVTQRLLDTSAPHDMAKLLNTDINTAIRSFRADEFLNGDGILPNSLGLITASDAYTEDDVRAIDRIKLVKSGSDGSFDADNLFDLIADLDARYKGQNCALYAHTSAVTIMRKLKDSQGQYLWTPAGGITGAAQTLAGWRVVESQYMPPVGSGSKSILFGDVSQLAATVVNSKGYHILRDPYSNRGWVSFYTTLACGSGVVDGRAARVLELAV